MLQCYQLSCFQQKLCCINSKNNNNNRNLFFVRCLYYTCIHKRFTSNKWDKLFTISKPKVNKNFQMCQKKRIKRRAKQISIKEKKCNSSVWRQEFSFHHHLETILDLKLNGSRMEVQLNLRPLRVFMRHNGFFFLRLKLAKSTTIIHIGLH